MHQEWQPLLPGSDNRNDRRKPGKPLPGWTNRFPRYVPNERQPLESLNAEEQEETRAAIAKLQEDLHQPVTASTKRKTLRTISDKDKEELARLYKESGLGNETPNDKLN